MGNRANVIFCNGERISPCIYLHWNGGPDSVYAFLEELDRRKVRPDAEYEAARFCQLVGEFFDQRKELGGLSLGVLNGPSEISVEALGRLMTDQGDNGFYVVNRTLPMPDGMRRFRATYRREAADLVTTITETARLPVEREMVRARSEPQYGRILKWFARVTDGWDRDPFTG